MAIPEQYQADVQAILDKQQDNGGDYWATADGRVGVGGSFSTIACVLMLSDLGMAPSHPALKGAVDLILACWRKDGRFRIAPKGALYPCYTAAAARTLCRAGYAQHPRLERTFDHLLETAYQDGGWRCNSFKFGRGPETESSNPGPTLDVLDAFRFSDRLNREHALDKAVEFLLEHWVIRKPLGPCHFGMGSRFMQVEYPLRRYNLFNYVYVLSYYDRAKDDPRFLAALQALESKLVAGQVVVENPHDKLAGFSFCQKGNPSAAATGHYQEILGNLGRD